MERVLAPVPPRALPILLDHVLSCVLFQRQQTPSPIQHLRAATASNAESIRGAKGAVNMVNTMATMLKTVETVASSLGDGPVGMLVTLGPNLLQPREAYLLTLCVARETDVTDAQIDAAGRALVRDIVQRISDMENLPEAGPSRVRVFLRALRSNAECVRLLKPQQQLSVARFRGLRVVVASSGAENSTLEEAGMLWFELPGDLVGFSL